MMCVRECVSHLQDVLCLLFAIQLPGGCANQTCKKKKNHTFKKIY